jgi:uncharacterized protein
VDRAGLLSASARSQLEQRLAAYEAESGHQIVVHTTPSLEGLPIEDYSIRLAEAWKVGHKGLDNGVILTVAPSERKVRIEVGYGLEGVIPDAIASRIIRDYILPAFRQEGYERGILSGVEAIFSAARGEVVPARSRVRPGQAPQRQSNPAALVWLLVFLLFGFRGFFFLPFIGGGRNRGGFGGGFGGGGGGFSGGGGGFGGGGASGGW